jgi:flagellar assembly protein FliH
MSSAAEENDEDKCQRWSLPDLGQSDTGYSGKVTAEELEKIQQQAYQEGFERGRLEGLDAGRQEMIDGAIRLQQLMYALTRPFEDLDQAVEQELLELVFSITRQLVGSEIQANPGQIMTIVRRAVAVLPSASRNLQLHLHPEDAQLVRELLPASDGETQWHIIEDITVGRGGCRVSTDTSQVDATVEARLDNIIASLLGSEGDEDSQE